MAQASACEFNIPAESVRVFLMHQANRNLMDRAARALGVPPDRFFANIGRYGNTSSASMLIAAAEWREGVYRAQAMSSVSRLLAPGFTGEHSSPGKPEFGYGIWPCYGI